MRKLSVIVFASLGFLSFGAFAGDNCFYGKEKNLAASAVEDAVIAEGAAEKVDPTLLALLKKQQAEKEQLQQVITFN